MYERKVHYTGSLHVLPLLVRIYSVYIPDTSRAFFRGLFHLRVIALVQMFVFVILFQELQLAVAWQASQDPTVTNPLV